MFRRTSLMLAVLTPIALCAGLVAAPAAAAPPVTPTPAKPTPAKPTPAKPDTAKAAEEIKKSGKLSGADHWRLVEARHPGQKRTTIAAKPFLKPKAAAGALAPVGRSQLTVVGGAGLPEGFGHGFVWDRAESEAVLVVFVNAADSLGVCIDGLQAGDQLQVMSATGVASFSEDKGNPLASGIVGLVATGANLAATVLGAPEVAPVITAAEKFAQDQFKATNAKTKKRDVYGVETGTGHKARQEGGVLVCLPEARGTFYSGNGDHKERWIKGDGVRTDDHIPAHVFGSFFPRRESDAHNTRTVQQTGQAYLVAWDWKFEDNAGFYRVVVKLKKGNGPGPIVIERKSPTTPKAKP